ncbi:HD family phosphohydrolase [Granulicatella sp. zg-84]|uniref:HD family phosphohydrolase n=1 Tax=unclassified Granulicatella TaxID=2630493 RepID=UPI0013CF6478|nr:HDIG domain-containing protein [Carnobacteriaceae bacterium zg-84]
MFKKFIRQFDEKLGSFYVPFVLLVTTAILLLMSYPIVKPTETAITLNSVATQTIRANKTIEDIEATDKAKAAVAKNVQDIYENDETIAVKKLGEVTKFFEIITNFRKELAQSADATIPIAQKTADIISRFFTSLNDENKIIHNYAYGFSEALIKKLLVASETDYKTYETLTKKVVEQILKEDIYPTDIAKSQSQANAQILTLTYFDDVRETVTELVRPAIVATMVVNKEATILEGERAKAGVLPVMITQGEVIVREGEAIGATAYRKLTLLGMTNNTYNNQLLIGCSIVLVMQFSLVWYFICKQAKTNTKRHLYVNMYATLMVMLTGLVLVANLVQKSGLEYFSLIVPIGVIPLFLIPKAKRRLAILCVSFLVTLCFFLGDGGNTIQTQLVWKFYALIAMFSTVVVSGKRKKPLLQHFIVLLILNVGFIIALAFFHDIAITSNTFIQMMLYSILNAILTIGILRIGQPYFDILFEDKAVLRMLELSNPNQPMLKELIAKAPGTYHHSIMVANLSANAVELIGGDSLFTRVACYYHDVGKLKKPMFFVENLPSGMENPHKLLTPQESRDIIFEHVTAGVEMLKEAGMPQSIIDICAQHHGTTIMKYFYVTAKEDDDTVDEKDFRYPGPRPTTKEAAVISIADTVEAAARSMKNPSFEAIRDLVKGTIQSRITDGQFDDCPITMKELKIVEDSLITGLSSSYHTRVEYPKLKK